MPRGRVDQFGMIATFASSYAPAVSARFLCGLIDADGGTKRIYISTSSDGMAQNVQDICSTFDITTRTHAYDVFHIYLRKSDFQNACRQYGFSSIKHRYWGGEPGRTAPS